ncbi:MAG: 2,3-bisphosphoglycerate-independent phosphoglycerate mutase [Spirochaetes bacterium]|jgi:2,3-bisphosphoglycerate-independent phosphoglycerate mutase|nr:2,3-bisphosphoglycerate-independent phosphoglycerate mutase [Spirochaetota bacterium]
MTKLNKLSKFNGRKGPVVLIIMDGVGNAPDYPGNAFINARTPTLDSLKSKYLNTEIKAHGTAVGLPSDEDMGNSEVGHNALGAGRIFDQGAKLVEKALLSGDIFTTDAWKEVVQKPITDNTTLHFLGLLSDGNVHSNIAHLFKMLERAANEGIKNVRVHILLDGRDVPETSGLEYVNALEDELKKLNSRGLDYRIASGGGRMITTMDRYGADWRIVERGWQAHVLGEAAPFKSATEAIEFFRAEKPGLADQFLPSFTIIDENGPVGTIEDGDSVIFFNYRGDRSIEITQTFEKKEFDKFDRKRFPNIVYAGMMEYDGDLHLPKNYLVQPPEIDRSISEYLANANVKQFAISETQKFGHVTYFWNGNKTGKFNEETETYKEITSDRVPFEERPWMKAADITDAVIEAIESGEYPFIRLNFANGDMVGHTGHLEAAITAMQTVDLSIERLLPVIEKAGGIAVITADHGNLDEMWELDKNGEILYNKDNKPKKRTAHTLNKVPFIIFDPQYNNEYRLAKLENEPGLGNVASTLLNLLGYDKPEEYYPSIISFD